MSAKLKHSAQDGEANGGLSPAKMPRMDDGKETTEERIARMKELLSKGKAPPSVRPKPKPKPKLPSITVSEQKMDDGSPLTSPDPEELEPVLLNPESLAQFSQIADFDFDAVVRQQILDNTPQKDRAALSQSKGLKDRRLPANLATKVPDDYQARRRAQSYSTGDLKRKEKLAKSYDATDSGLREEMSEEERKRKILERSGVTQSSPLAALGSILKRRGSGRSKKSPLASPVLKPKPKKEKPSKDSPSMTKKISEPLISTPPKSPKGFLRRWGSKGSGRKKGKLGSEFGSLDGSVDDVRSETSSISSFQTSGREVPMETEHSKSISPEETPVKLIKENGDMDTGSKPPKEKSPEPPPVVANTSVSSVRGKHDSACFHEADVEPLFGDTSTLFDSGELENMFGKGGKSGGRKSRERTPEKILEEPAAEKKEEKAERRERTKPEEKVTKATEKPSAKLAEKSPAEKSPAETPAEKDDVKKVAKSTEKPSQKPAEKPSQKPAEKSAAETLAERRLAERLASAKPAEKSPKSPKADIRARMHMYEPSSTPSTEEKEKSVSTSTPKHETTTAAKKTTLLFEDEESNVFASKSKENKEKKMDVERKKARLFDDELFQDDLKSEPPKKPAAKKELFSSPARKSKEASESPQRQKKSSLEEENKETSDLGPSISFLDEVLMATSSKSSFDEPSEKPSAEKEEESKEDKPKEEKDSKKPHGFGLSGLMEYDESPRPAAKQDKEKKLDEIADSIFGTKAAEEKQEREKKLDEIADSLFGEDPRHAARARRRAKKHSSEPAERTDMSEPTSDPLGALEEKTAVEKESEERQRKLFAKERKAKTTDLFGEEIMEVDAPSDDVGSKVSGSSEQSQRKPSPSPEIIVQESTPPPAPAAASAGDKAETDTATKIEEEEENKGVPATDTEKKEKSKTESRVGDVKSKADARDARLPSSRTGRNRDSTAEMVKTAAERKSKIPAREEKKDEDGSKPSWMVELQKRKERIKSEGEEKKTKVASGSVSKDKETKEVPEWQKRAMERRKKAAEASKSSPSSSRLSRDRPEKTSASSSKLDKSPRTGRRVTSETATAASPKSGRGSPKETDTTTTTASSLRTGRRSPRDVTDTATATSPKTGRRSPRSADTSPTTSLKINRRSSPRDKEEGTDSAGRKSPVRFKSKYREELEREKAEKEKAAKASSRDKEESTDSAGAKSSAGSGFRSKYREYLEREKAEKEKAAAKTGKGGRPALSKKPTDATLDSKSAKVARNPSMERKSAKIEISTKKVARSEEKEEREEQKVPSFTDDVQPAKKPEETKPESLSDREKTRQSGESVETKKEKKSQSEPEEDTDDVFPSEAVKSPSAGENKVGEEKQKLRSPSPQVSNVLTKATSVDSGNSSRRSSVSSETAEQPPYRSRNMSHSRSPTPTLGQPSPGPMKLPPSDSSVPEWKKKLMERKKSGEGVRKTKPVVAKQDSADLPSWKKELMAKKRSKSPELFTSSLREVRSSTVSTDRPSQQSRGAGRSGKADRKKEEPAFMKEFQLKKHRSTARET